MNGDGLASAWDTLVSTETLAIPDWLYPGPVGGLTGRIVSRSGDNVTVEIWWDPVVINQDGSPITDLVGYVVRVDSTYLLPETDWGGTIQTSTAATVTVPVDPPAYVAVRAVDEAGNQSAVGACLRASDLKYIVVADDRQTISDYNTALHPNQKLYPGKTRLEVLTENQNPKLQNLNKSLLYRYIGNETKTTIRRNMYMTVQGSKFQLSSPNIIDMLEPGNYNVVAYWMPNNDGNIETVYIYQNGLFVDTCSQIERYNEAKAEQTERDQEAYTNQSKYVSKFDAKVKQGRKAIAKIEVLQPVSDEWDSQPVELPEETNEIDETGYEDTGDFYSDNAINSL